MKTPIKRIGIIPQVACLFLIGTLIIGVFTSLTQRAISVNAVLNQTNTFAGEIAEEVRLCVWEYPAHNWLLRYWYEHPDELDIEYDADYNKGPRTKEKSRILLAHQPGLFLKYTSEAELEALPEEDQKLYAEVVYSWLITRVNQIKRTYQIDYLFCVATDESCETQFFLFSAADPGSVRGTEYEQIYPLGVTVSVSDAQKQAMRNAVDSSVNMARAGDYIDFYYEMGQIGEHPVLIGMTYNLSDLMSEVTATTEREIATTMFLLILLALLCLVMISQAVLQPLRKVQRNIRDYKQNKDSAAVIENLSKVQARNEIGELSEDVSELVREIDDYVARITTITDEKKRIETELSLAARIQASMLPNIYPPFPDRSEFDIFASMVPARGVGGDFYDYFLTDPDHLCLVMADVSGKGVPAALFMMVSKIILANNAMMGKTPSQILADTNAAICANNPEEMFVTVWLGILELSTGRLSAANAGHEYPVLKAPDGAYTLLNDKHGFVIGGMPGMKYASYELTLEPGSRLFLYTDGLPEATNADNAMLGNERMLAALNSEPDANPQALLHAVQKAVNAFVQDAEQFDDLTMLGLEYRGPQKQS